MNITVFIQTSLYFLALINPASKIFILSSMQPALTKKELARISIKSSFAALVILLILSGAGHFILKTIFHVEIYSLAIAGGIVLFIIGLSAVRNGRFYEKSFERTGDDISIVPLAAPLIAGPGTITAAISFSAAHGEAITAIALTTAIILNFMLMLSSLWIAKMLDRYQVFGPLIRITGLIVAAVAVQMVLTGIQKWIEAVPVGGM